MCVKCGEEREGGWSPEAEVDSGSGSEVEALSMSLQVPDNCVSRDGCTTSGLSTGGHSWLFRIPPLSKSHREMGTQMQIG